MKTHEVRLGNTIYRAELEGTQVKFTRINQDGLATFWMPYKLVYQVVITRIRERLHTKIDYLFRETLE